MKSKVRVSISILVAIMNIVLFYKIGIINCDPNCQQCPSSGSGGTSGSPCSSFSTSSIDVGLSQFSSAPTNFNYDCQQFAFAQDNSYTVVPWRTAIDHGWTFDVGVHDDPDCSSNAFHFNYRFCSGGATNLVQTSPLGANTHANTYSFTCYNDRHLTVYRPAERNFRVAVTAVTNCGSCKNGDGSYNKAVISASKVFTPNDASYSPIRLQLNSYVDVYSPCNLYTCQ